MKKSSGSQRKGGPLKGISSPSFNSMQQVPNGDQRKFKWGQENNPGVDPNVQKIDSLPSFQKPSVEKGRNPKSNEECKSPSASSGSDVKVFARIRPQSNLESEGSQIVRNVSSDSLAVGDQIFGFDSVLDSKSTQEDMFKLVGIPLVENCLAGFNCSILCYGQTGGGKTYTMWGPQNSMVEEISCNSQHGLAPRIFKQLFLEIQKEQEISDKLVNYQCRCSFLEIYNDKISDLLDPTQRNLQIKEDVKNSVYVENLTEEYVSAVEDITHLLIKGLSNRKMGGTSMNSKSSRSHIVFTCIIESWCKESSSSSFNSTKTSRINLVDLAGLERQKLGNGDNERKKEARNVNQSLSQLGNLIYTLSDVNLSGKPRSVPYKQSSLTYLLQDCIGGNAKLAIVCSISPEERCKCETLSTLRFGLRAKVVQNNAVVNEITEDDMNDLSDQIRLLKEELVRVKTDGKSYTNRGYFTGSDARKSLNILRSSLNRSLLLPKLDDVIEEEMNIDEADVKELCIQLDELHASCEENVEEDWAKSPSCEPGMLSASTNGCINNSDLLKDSQMQTSEIQTCSIDDGFSNPENGSRQGLQGNNSEEMDLSRNVHDATMNLSIGQGPAKPVGDLAEITKDGSLRDSLRISDDSVTTKDCQPALNLKDPTSCESPRFETNRKKNIINLSNLSTCHDQSSETPNNSTQKNLRSSLAESVRKSSNVLYASFNKNIKSPAESLAASLHRGLEIIENHERGSASMQSSVEFSFQTLGWRPSQAVDKVDASMQTISEDGAPFSGVPVLYLCSSCKKLDMDRNSLVNGTDDHDYSHWSLVLSNGSETLEGSKVRVSKEVRDILASSIKREITSDINLVNRMHEGDKQENHTGTLDADNGTKELQIELQHEHKSSFNPEEREFLLKEIQDLRNQLQAYKDSPANSHETPNSIISLKQSQCPTERSNNEEFELERQRWTEMESRWISLTEELTLDLDSNRRLAEKKEQELNAEKKCSEELDDALQRAIHGHARIIEHYSELQEKYNSLLLRHRKIQEGIADVKRAAARAGAKGRGSKFLDSLAAELSALRVEREREREYLKKENTGLRTQLRDTAEAVHTAGELLVRLKEAEETAAIAEQEGHVKAKQETQKVKKEMEKMKKRHAEEIARFKQFLAETRLPKSALKPLLRDSENAYRELQEENQEWRSEFEPFYQQSNDWSKGPVFTDPPHSGAQSKINNGIWEKWSQP
ncbi:hypothetical protein AMTRI_Chr10g5290 [Amborella trichopoda]